MPEAVMLLPQPLSPTTKRLSATHIKRNPVKGLVAAVIHIDIGFEILNTQDLFDQHRHLNPALLHVCGVP